MASNLKYINKLKDHRVLVIGGSSGMGYAVAEAALEHGAQVIISSHNQSKLDSAVTRLKEHAKSAGLENPVISAKTCDLADPENIDGNVDALLKFATEDGKLDHVVVTAGDPLNLQKLDTVTVEDMHQMSMVRVTAAIILAKHLPKYMNNSLRSSFTLTSGTMAWRPAPGWSVMLGVGSGTEALARGLAIDLKPVRVNCVLPGSVYTEALAGIPADRLEAILEKKRRDSITRTVGTPGEVAEAYLFFMKSTFATATTVRVDGGRVVGDSKDEK